MHTKFLVAFHVLLMGNGWSVEAASQPSRTLIYKTIGDVELTLHMFDSTNHEKSPAIVFFFGGGWVGGSPQQFYPQCAHLASQGIAAFSAEYRIKSKHQTTPFDCVADGKSALRWLRANAGRLNIDADRIIAAGGSAGGHVAACTALIPSPAEAEEKSSCIPNALVLYNPVIDTGPDGYGYPRLKQRYREISPIDHVRSNLPPTIIFQGTADTTTPVSGHREFQRRMIDAGNMCHLKLFPNQKHGFFNPGRGDKSGFPKTTKMLDEFLIELGYVQRDQ